MSAIVIYGRSNSITAKKLRPSLSVPLLKCHYCWDQTALAFLRMKNLFHHFYRSYQINKAVGSMSKSCQLY